MKRQSCREAFWVLLLAGAGRSDVNALNEGSVQCDVEFLQGLQHSDQGIDERVVLDQRHILIHVCSDRAVGQQGYPVVQEVISGRVGVIQVKEKQAKAKGVESLELSVKMKKLYPSPTAPLPSLKELAFHHPALGITQHNYPCHLRLLFHLLHLPRQPSTQQLLG